MVWDTDFLSGAVEAAQQVANSVNEQPPEPPAPQVGWQQDYSQPATDAVATSDGMAPPDQSLGWGQDYSQPATDAVSYNTPYYPDASNPGNFQPIWEPNIPQGPTSNGMTLAESYMGSNYADFDPNQQPGYSAPNAPYGYAYNDFTGQYQPAENLREQGLASGAISGSYGLGDFNLLGDVIAPAYGAVTDYLSGIPLMGVPSPSGDAGPPSASLNDFLGTQLPWADIYGPLGSGIGQGLYRAADPFNLLGGQGVAGDVGQAIAENTLPQNWAQLGIEGLPGIGSIPGTLSFLEDAGRIGLQGAIRNVIAGGGEDALRNLLPDLPPDLQRAVAALPADQFPDANVLSLANRYGPDIGGGPSGFNMIPNGNGKEEIGRNVNASIDDLRSQMEQASQNVRNEARGSQGGYIFDPPLSQQEGDEMARLVSMARGQTTSDPRVMADANAELNRMMADMAQEGRLTTTEGKQFHSELQGAIDRLNGKVDEVLRETPNAPPAEVGNKIARDPEIRQAREQELAKAFQESDQQIERSLGVAGPEGPRQFTTPGYEPPAALLPERTASSFAVPDFNAPGLYKNAPGDLSFLQRPDFSPEARLLGGVKDPAALRQEGLFSYMVKHPEEVLAAPRTFMAGADLSYALRQMIPMAGAHPTDYVGALGTMLKAMGAETAAADIMRGIREDSLWSKLGIRGPAITEHMAGRAADREEAAIAAGLIDHIPGLRNFYTPTERGNITALNKLRSDVVDQYIRHRVQDLTSVRGDLTALSAAQKAQLAQEAQRYANFVSRFTGYGNLGALERSQAATILSQVMFSARNAISKPQALAYLIDRPFSPVWNQVVKDMAGFIGLGSTGIGLAVLAGASTNLDPRSTDFGKITLPGGEHIDIWGGYQQLVRSVTQIATGERTSSTGTGYVYKLNDEERLKIATDFLRNKLSPQAALATDAILGGRNFGGPQGAFGISGKIGAPLDRALQYLTPLWLQDIATGLRVDGLKGGAIGALSALGAGTQFYKSGQSVYGEQLDADKRLAQDAGRLTAAGVPQGVADAMKNESPMDWGTREKQVAASLRDGGWQQKWTDFNRQHGNEFQKAIDEQDKIRADYQPLFSMLEGWLKDGQHNPYEVRQLVRDAEKSMNDALYAVQFPQGTSDREKSQIQQLEQAYRAIIQNSSEGGKVNWEVANQTQKDFLQAVRSQNPALGDRLAYNIEQRPNPKDAPILQTLDQLRPVVDELYALPKDQQLGWRIENPQKEGMLVAYGFLGSVHSPQAAEVAKSLNGAYPDVTIRIQDGPAVPNNPNYPGAREARDVYFNLPENQKLEWLVTHPQQDAVLVASGYNSSVHSMDAYQLLQGRR